MVRINFKGSNIGEGEFREVEIFDNAEQVAKRNERYMEDLRIARDAQTQVDSNYIREYEASLKAGQRSQQEENKRKIAAAQTVANQQIKSLQAQAKEMKTITGMSNNITGKGDKKVDDWIKFVTNTSKKAADVYAGIQEEESAFQWNQGIAKAHMFGATWDDVAWKRRWDDAGIIGASKEQLAAVAAASGADPDYVASIRDGNTHYIQATRHALATDMLGKSTDIFKTKLSSDAQTIVDIRDQNGQTKKVPLNEIDRTNLSEIQQAYYQWLPNYIRENGFGDASPEFLNDGLQKAKQSYDTYMGEIRQKQIDRSNNERLESAYAELKSELSPIKFKGAVNTEQNINPSITPKAAHELVIQKLGNIIDFPDQAAVDSVLDNTIVGGGATLRQAYTEAVIKMNKARVDAVNDRFNANESRREAEENAEIDELNRAVEADRKDDNKINQITNDQLEELAVKAFQEGKTDLAGRLRNLKTQTVDGIRQAYLTDSWDEIFANGGIVTPQQIISSGVDDKIQAKYITKANESIATSVPDDQKKSFEEYAKTALRNRAKIDFVKSSAVSRSVNAAIDEALERYLFDYRTARKTMSAIDADKYARGLFEKELSNTEGLYKIAPFNIKTNPDGHPYLHLLPKAVEPVDDWGATFAKSFESKGDAAYREGIEELRPAIDSSLKTLKYKGRFSYPPQINQMALQSNGRYTSLDVLRMQADDLGIQLPPEFTEAEKVESAIGPAYKKFVSYKPSAIRTDVALISAGAYPVYGTTTALGEQVKKIVSKRESPNAGYDAINAGTGGDRPGGAKRWLGKPLTRMSVKEVMYYQNLPLDHPNGIFAVGRYQFIPTTLAAAVKRSGIDENMLFNEAVQDRIFFVHLDDNGLYQPWEKWWIEQGGPGLATTPQEKAIIEQFRAQYNPNDPWRSPRNMNPAVLKTMKTQEVE